MAVHRNLDSAAECAVARINFVHANKYDFPIVAFTAFRPVLCAIALKTCILTVDREHPTNPVDAVRLEHQALHSIPPNTAGTLYLLEAAAYLRGKDAWPVTIWALTLPRNDQVRWFWSMSNTSDVLRYLHKQKLISTPRAVEYSQRQHQQLFTSLKMLFEHFAQIPDSPEFKQASQMTDWCIDIEDPESACLRLEKHKYLRDGWKGIPRDMSDDRYLLELEPAERQVASMLGITAAKYLLIKRLYFKTFMNELIHNRRKIPVSPRGDGYRAATQSGRRVGTTGDAEEDEEEDISRASTPATDASKVTPKGQKSTAVRLFSNHLYRLRTRNGWSYSQARACAEAWRELGFFDEESYVDWIDAGGMFETIGLQDDALQSE